jgi:hypothetical protein
MNEAEIVEIFNVKPAFRDLAVGGKVIHEL